MPWRIAHVNMPAPVSVIAIAMVIALARAIVLYRKARGRAKGETIGCINACTGTGGLPVPGSVLLTCPCSLTYVEYLIPHSHLHLQPPSPPSPAPISPAPAGGVHNFTTGLTYVIY